ncbi:metalloendopeptidase [Plakobranchus ocellatus]|uniref:Metalloendopeptidase n=1 Tax=Plakobranchus ocellatus TaxID=259542 RepID=A0AAV3Y6Q6_9GAST|nr:metalloendopeptidase [Plakobranchus ocellatus]
MSCFLTKEYRSPKRGHGIGSSRNTALLDFSGGPLSSPSSLRGFRGSSLSSLRDRYLDTGIGSLGLGGRRLDALDSSFLFDRYDILNGGSRGSMRAAQRDFYVGGGGGSRFSQNQGSGLAELARGGRLEDFGLYQQQNALQTSGLTQPSSSSLLGGSGALLTSNPLGNQFSNFGQPVSSSSLLGGQQQLLQRQPRMQIQQQQQPQQIVIQAPPQQAQLVSPMTSATTGFSGSVPISTVVQSVPVQFQQVQQVPINTVMQPTSILLQQTPVVGVAAQPQTTTILQTVSPQVVPQTAAASTNTNSGFGGLSGMGSRLGVRPPGPFSGMAPVIVKIEDMFPPSQHPVASESGISSGQEGGSTGKGLTMGYNGDPNLSVMKLDEGLQVVINHSDPNNRIVNFPTPTNEAEAKALKKILEKAEAPEYIREMVQIKPMMATDPGAAAVNAAAVAASASAAAVAAAATGIAQKQQQQAAAINAAVNTATTQVAAMNAAVVPASPQAFPPTATAVAGAASPTVILDRSDLPIDEILTGAYSMGMQGGAASFPMASTQTIGNGRFVLTALDMELTPQQFAELHPSSSSGHTYQRVKRKALTNLRARWEGGIIPFELRAGDFSAGDQQKLMAAMSQWSQSTCIQFRQAMPTDANKLVIQSGRGCSSNVGMIGGTQFLTLQRECRIPKILLHELGHAIGLIHEHQREDRDNYLKIHYANIKPGGVKDFDMFKRGSVEHGYAAYDYMSIMHYGKSAFSRDGKSITMQAVDPKFTNIMGTASRLSYSDVSTVNAMYGCGGGMGGVASSMGGMMSLATDVTGGQGLGGAGLSMPATLGAANGGTIVKPPLVLSPAAVTSGGTIVSPPIAMPQGGTSATGGTIVSPPIAMPQGKPLTSGGTIVSPPMISPQGGVPANSGATVVSPPIMVPQVNAGTGGTIITSPIVVSPSATKIAQTAGAGKQSIAVTGSNIGTQMGSLIGTQAGPNIGQPQVLVQMGSQGGSRIGNQMRQDFVKQVGQQVGSTMKQQLGPKMGQQIVTEMGRLDANKGQQTGTKIAPVNSQMGSIIEPQLGNQNAQQLGTIKNSGGVVWYQVQTGNVRSSQLQEMVAASAQQQNRGGQMVRELGISFRFNFPFFSEKIIVETWVGDKKIFEPQCQLLCTGWLQLAGENISVETNV